MLDEDIFVQVSNMNENDFNKTKQNKTNGGVLYYLFVFFTIASTLCLFLTVYKTYCFFSNPTSRKVFSELIFSTKG